jgi:hypothetical protein
MRNGQDMSEPPAKKPQPAELPEAARRALKEAEERRKKAESGALPAEKGGPKGLEPTRYGDWERKGILSDF